MRLSLTHTTHTYTNTQVIMEMLIEKGAYVRKTDRLLQKGIPTLETFDHLRRKNADNEMRAINKVGSSHTHTYDTQTRATIILSCVRACMRLR